jgi:hypothetical protein
MKKKIEKSNDINHVWVIGYLVDANSDKEICSPPLCVSNNLDLIKGVAIGIWGMNQLVYCYRFDLITGQINDDNDPFEEWSSNI